MNSVTDRAVFRDDAQRLRWTLRQRQNISRLLPEEFGWMIESMPKNGSPSSCQRLISVQQNQNQKVSTNFLKNWSRN